MESTLTAFHGNENLESVDIRNLKSGRDNLSRLMESSSSSVIYPILNF